ncbi:MAG: METTL5 family protein [Candidatus Thermoplasmatota archaeon]|nr:METTL5 family protein [Candidatus Thermoplasmatota archaeon]
MITKKRHLEITLQRIPRHPKPKANLEQYLTPATIAADVLWNAYALGDIEGKKVADLGCGTGIFAIGAALLGAKESVGVDIDPDATVVAEVQAREMEVSDTARFVSTDIQYFSENADTVIQNPPFGAQKAHRKDADRIFLSKSMEIAPVVYSFHLAETEKFVEKFVESLGASVTHRFYYRFQIPHTYAFHTKEKVEFNVVVLRIEKQRT